MVLRNLLLTSSCFAAFPAIAQTGDHHDASASEIVITAPYGRDRALILAGTTVLSKDTLDRAMRPSIGETLASQPGISATSFGPNASRPVLRGLQGERVRMLKDGIGSIDVSNTSVDHAPAINPLTATRIEVIKGPAALLYGSSAIGGVVNVLDTRIPRAEPIEFGHVDLLGTYGSASNERSIAGRGDLRVVPDLVIHVDGSYMKSSDLQTGGFILTPALRAQARAAGGAIADLDKLNKTLPNSAARTWDFGIGTAYIGTGGTLGISYSHYESLYGVPIRFSLDPLIEAEAVRLNARQDRLDLRAEVTPRGAVIDAIKLRAGFADYAHDEIEDSGAIGTQFFTKGAEVRLEIAQAKRGSWQGAFGGQLNVRDFNVIGAEAFLPKNSTEQWGLFTLQEVGIGPIRAEAGARVEKTVQRSPDIVRHFTALSGSLGGSIAVTDTLRIGLSGSYSERAPAAEELFANGPHKGTQAFEIGDPQFGLERAQNIEASFRMARSGLSINISAYHNWFDGFIYETPTGDIEDDLPVFQIRQGNARQWGLEGEARVDIFEAGATQISAEVVGDYTNVTIDGVGPAPRIPPARLLGALEAKQDRINVRAEVEWTGAQRKIAAFETPTNGFTRVNASIVYHPFESSNSTSLLLSANNIFDVEARRHASFLKDYAPLSGRDIRVTARISF